LQRFILGTSGDGEMNTEFWSNVTWNIYLKDGERKHDVIIHMYNLKDLKPRISGSLSIYFTYDANIQNLIHKFDDKVESMRGLRKGPEGTSIKLCLNEFNKDHPELDIYNKKEFNMSIEFIEGQTSEKLDNKVRKFDINFGAKLRASGTNLTITLPKITSLWRRLILFILRKNPYIIYQFPKDLGEKKSEKNEMKIIYRVTNLTPHFGGFIFIPSIRMTIKELVSVLIIGIITGILANYIFSILIKLITER